MDELFFGERHDLGGAPRRNRDISCWELRPPGESLRIAACGISFPDHMDNQEGMSGSNATSAAVGDARRRPQLPREERWSPSPEEIRTACLKIQAGWSEEERLARAQCAVRSERQLARVSAGRKSDLADRHESSRGDGS
jgi:hypothetical protein